MTEDKDIREVNLPETKFGEAGKKVDFTAAAKALNCTKVELTKNRMPDFIEYARAHGK